MRTHRYTFFYLLLCAVLLISIVPFGIFSVQGAVSEEAIVIHNTAEVLCSGICGADVEFTLYSDGYLELTGSGPMGEYPYSEAPWFNHRSQIKHLVVHEGITNISSYAFSACADMVTATLADSVTEIGKFAFDCCYALTSIHFGNGLTTIGNSVFRYCEKLEDAVLPESLTSMGEFAFFSCCSLPEVTIPKNMTQISFGAFMFCSGMKQIEIPEGVTQIDDYGLRGCSSLTEVVLPESITRIGVGAFTDCTNMESVNIPAGVTEICNDAFSSCASLKKVVIPQGITEIAEYAFFCCEGLKEIVIPDSVTTIHDDAFASCTSLPEINIPESVTYIGEGVFNSCNSLYQVTLPSGITFVGDHLFAYCENLLSVTIPASVTSIDYRAFYWCDNLVHVLYTGTAEQWEAIRIEEGNGTLQWGDHHNEAKGDEFVVYNRETCTHKEYYACTICGLFVRDPIPNGKHSFSAWTAATAPTCTQKGTERRDCTKCEYYETRETVFSDHTYTSEVIPPTFTQTGYTLYTCIHCGDCYTADEVPTLPAAAVVDSIEYGSVREALNAAVPGDVVTLMADVTENSFLTIDEGVTLDLAGFDLTVKSLNGLAGSSLTGIRYGNEGHGRLFVAKDRLSLTDAVVNGQNQVIPYWDPNGGCYVLANTRIKDVEGAFIADEETKTISFKFSYGAGSAANKDFLSDGAEDNAMVFVVRLQWESENGVAYQDFVYKNEYVSTLAQSGGNFTFKLTGYDALNIDLATFSIQGMIITDCGIIVAGTEYTA